jgi:hypothetical protein
MNKYTFSVAQTYPVAVKASDEDEAYQLVYDKMQGVDDWEVLFVEAECTNCGSIPEEVITESYTYTVCPNGCFIAI